jgi:hypothetical protein
VPQALSAKKMEPRSCVTANVDVCCVEHLNLLASRRIKRPEVDLSIVPSNKVCFAILSFVLAFPLFGTSEAIIVSADKIVIAADGAAGITIGNRKTVSKFCKTRHEGDKAYTMTGQYLLNDFDVWAVLESAARRSKTVQDAIEAVQPVIYSHLPDIINYVKSANPAQYSRWLTGIPIITVSFAAFEMGVPTATSLWFQIDAKGELMEPGKNLTRITSHKEAAQIGLLGYNDAMKSAISKQNWRIAFAGDPIEFSRGLVQLEIDKAAREDRVDVGPPISVMVVDSRGIALANGQEGACYQ